MTAPVIEWVTQGDYGCGWEDLTVDDTKKDGREMRRCYDENEPGIPHRLIRRVVKS